MVLCSGHIFFSPLTKSYHIYHMSVSLWENGSHLFMTSEWPWPLALITKLYFHNEFMSWQDCLWHETTFHAHFLPLYDLDLCLLYGWRGISQFLSCFFTCIEFIIINGISFKSDVALIFSNRIINLQLSGPLINPFCLLLNSYVKFYIWVFFSASFWHP